MVFFQGIIGTVSGTLWYVNWEERASIRLVSGHAQQVRLTLNYVTDVNESCH